MYKRIRLRELEEKFRDIEKQLDYMLLGTYQHLFLLKDDELLKENDNLIEARENIRRLGMFYREIKGYDSPEPPVYGKIVSRLKSLRNLLVREWNDRWRERNFNRFLEDI